MRRVTRLKEVVLSLCPELQKWKQVLSVRPAFCIFSKAVVTFSGHVEPQKSVEGKKKRSFWLNSSAFGGDVCLVHVKQSLFVVG